MRKFLKTQNIANLIRDYFKVSLLVVLPIGTFFAKARKNEISP